MCFYIFAECNIILGIWSVINANVLHIMLGITCTVQCINAKRKRKDNDCITPYYQALIFSFRTAYLLFFLPSAISSLVTRRSQPLHLQEKNRSYVRQEVAGWRRATKEKEIGFQR